MTGSSLTLDPLLTHLNSITPSVCVKESKSLKRPIYPLSEIKPSSNNHHTFFLRADDLPSIINLATLNQQQAQSKTLSLVDEDNWYELMRNSLIPPIPILKFCNILYPVASQQSQNIIS